MGDVCPGSHAGPYKAPTAHHRAKVNGSTRRRKSRVVSPPMEGPIWISPSSPSPQLAPPSLSPAAPRQGSCWPSPHFFSHFAAFALIDLCSSVSSTSRCSRLQTFLAPSLPPTVNSTLRVQALGCARDPTEDTRS